MFYYLFLFLLSIGFLSLDGPRIIFNRIYDKYTRFRSLNQLVSTSVPKNGTKNQTLLILWISFKMILQALYLNLCQMVNKSVVKIDRNLYEIRYVIEGRTYHMLVRPRRGPNKILQVIDGDEDVTDYIIHYLGPQEDGRHSHPITPSIFKRESLVFNTSDGEEVIFSHDDEVKIE